MTSGSEIPQELRRMLADVCVEHNVRIDSDDPAVAIVSLNRLVLEAALNRAVEQIRTATADLEAQLQSVQLRAGALLAQELRTAIRKAVIDLNNEGLPVADHSRSRRRFPSCSLLFSGFTIASAFGAGVWFGTLVR